MLQTCSDLVSTGRCKDGTSNASGEQATANISREARFVTRASTADYRHVRGGRKSGRVSIDYLIRFVEDERGIRKSQGAQSCMDGVGWIVDEVFG